MIYYVRITETMSCSVGVEAKSEDAALRHAYLRWANGDYVLDSEDFQKVDVSIDECLQEKPSMARTIAYKRDAQSQER